MPKVRQTILWCAAVVALAGLLVGSLQAAKDATVEELKTRLSGTAVGDRPKLCLEIAERQLAATDKFYAATEPEKAQGTLTDVVAFSELARDYAVQSHKYQKQTEISVRMIARKLADFKHTVAHEDQAAVQEAINRLQRVRDDLLAAMFHKGSK
jgi:hypothetical protein